MQAGIYFMGLRHLFKKIFHFGFRYFGYFWANQNLNQHEL